MEAKLEWLQNSNNINNKNNVECDTIRISETKYNYVTKKNKVQELQRSCKKTVKSGTEIDYKLI